MTDSLHSLRIDTRGPTPVAVIAGEIDASNAATVASELSARESPKMVIDLGDVRYLDSAGIAMLDELRRSCQLFLVVPEQSMIHRTMKIVGFDQLVPVFASIDDALASAGREPDGV
jgi:anti-anti-sigma factor